MEAAHRGTNLGSLTNGLLKLLSTYGATELEHAVAEALAGASPHLAAVRQLLEQHQQAQGKPPPLPISLPDDPRVRGLNVRPHSLNSYDALTKEHDDDQETDG